MKLQYHTALKLSYQRTPKSFSFTVVPRTVFLQLLEFYGDHERAKEVLVDYAEKNVANINAHKYMYNLYQRYDSDSSEKIVFN